MLSIKLKEKWHAIIATAGAASRKTTGRRGPVVSDPADVTDAQPRHRGGVRIEIREAEHHAAQPDQGVVTAAHEIDEWLAGILVERGHGGVRRRGGLLSVAEAVDHRNERPLPHALDETQITRLRLPGMRQRGERR